VTRRRAGCWLVACAIALQVQPAPSATGLVGLVGRAGLPARLADAEFRALIRDFSEPDGFFSSDNLVSNEDTFQTIIPDLMRVVKPGGVYVGVGPDQNFTYIAAVKPAVVFIPDVRRGNLHMHLMYKALMEQSADRAEFLSRLFSRRRPDGLTAASTPAALFNAFAEVPASRAIFERTSADVRATLASHGFELTDEDARGIDRIRDAFFSAGPWLAYSARQPFGTRYPTFADLQIAADLSGVERAYLATEDNYQSVRALQQKNLIVPLVGNFAGPKTLRAIGAWTRERGARVTTFYASNVEQYLFQDGRWGDFAENLAALPVDGTSAFVRSCFTPCAAGIGGPRALMLLDSLPAMIQDHRAGLIRGYYDVLSRRR
jgi:hypothetical protein